MSGSTIGKNFTITTWGESHGVALGVCIDKVPAGIKISKEDIQQLLDRRKPGQSEFSTARNEEDGVEILSGIFEGVTTGTPIALLIYNKDQRSKDYGNLVNTFRPGHADYTFNEKYGIRDYRGGGRSSGRETISRVAAGAVAKAFLKELDIKVEAYTKEIGTISINEENFDLEEAKRNLLYMPDGFAFKEAEKYIKDLKSKGDSVGGVIECRINGLKSGIGEPVFDKLDASLAKSIFSIGAVKGFEIGIGCAASKKLGSENNDEFTSNEKIKNTNNAGGILGGISDGDEIVFRAYIKPTPSISKEQSTIDDKNNETKIVIKGRHDPIIVPRAVVVVEAMACITLVDLIIQDMSSRMDYIKEYYKRKINVQNS